jgi:hypothetical protein
MGEIDECDLWCKITSSDPIYTDKKQLKMGCGKNGRWKVLIGSKRLRGFRVKPLNP